MRLCCSCALFASRKNTPLEFCSMHFVEFVGFSGFSPPLPLVFFQNRVPLLEWLCQQDAHRSSLQIDVLRCSPLLSQSDFFCNSWKCRTLARMQTGINFGSPTNQLNRWAITNSVYSNQPTSQTQCLAHPVINELQVEVWKMQAREFILRKCVCPLRHPWPNSMNCKKKTRSRIQATVDCWSQAHSWRRLAIECGVTVLDRPIFGFSFKNQHFVP